MTRAANLLVLAGPLYPTMRPNPKYRGTCRACPFHFDDLPEEHEANALFYWFLEEGGELGVVHDERKARRLSDLSNQYGQGKSYEVIEVVDGNSTPFTWENSWDSIFREASAIQLRHGVCLSATHTVRFPRISDLFHIFLDLDTCEAVAACVPSRRR